MKLLIAALALGAPLATAPASAAVAPVTAPASDLDGLVQLLLPEQQLLEMTVVAAGTGLDDVYGGDFARYPGMRDYVLAQIKPEMNAAFIASLPELRKSIAAILARELTPQEITELYTFFASPTGRKLYAIMIEVAGKNAADSDEVIQKKMMDQIMANMTPDDYGPLATFGASSGAAKVQQFMPAVTEASREWTDKLVAQHGPRIRAVADKAVTDYKRQHPAAGK